MLLYVHKYPILRVKTVRDAVEKRRRAIEELVAEELIEDQPSLIARLLEKHGIGTTQVQISRDLHALGIGKGKVGDRMVYLPRELDRQRELLRLAVLSVRHNESTIVVQTMAGMAALVGDYLDNQEGLPLLGTLAGENVLFIAPLSTTQIQATYEAVCRLLHFTGDRS